MAVVIVVVVGPITLIRASSAITRMRACVRVCVSNAPFAVGVELDAQVSAEDPPGETTGLGHGQTYNGSREGTSQDLHIPRGDIHRCHRLSESTRKRLFFSFFSSFSSFVIPPIISEAQRSSVFGFLLLLLLLLLGGGAHARAIVFYDSRLAATARCVVSVLARSFAFHGRRDAPTFSTLVSLRFALEKGKKKGYKRKRKREREGGENRFDDDEVRRDGPWQLSLCPLVAIENNMRIRSDEDGGGDGGRSSDREVKFIRPGWRSVGSGSSLSRRLLSFSRLILRSRLSAVG